VLLNEGSSRSSLTIRTRRAVCRGLVLAVGVLAVALLSVPSAQARDYSYSCGHISPNTWCWALPTETFGFNRAWIPVSVNRNICSKLVNAGNTGYIYSRLCAYAGIVYVYSNDRGLAPHPNNSVWMRALIANGDNPYSINMQGLAEY
jgi:hypothetical protein